MGSGKDQVTQFEWLVEPEKMTKIGKAIILGSKSDIAQGLMTYLKKDGWSVEEWHRDKNIPLMVPWDLVIIALGRVSPVGFWASTRMSEFEDCMTSNLILPLCLLKAIWPWRKDNSSVCFMAGSNPNKIMPGYHAYNASKMALLKLCEQIDFETPDCKFFALGPGYVDTKIHRPTLEAGWKNERIEKGNSTPISKIYEALNWCLVQPKEIVGGRNICASDPLDDLYAKLEADPSMYKLRRHENL